MTFPPEMCRASRALLGWQQADLAKASRTAQKTISDFERGITTPWGATLERIKEAFEEAGLEFLPAIEGVSGEGVRFRWGYGAGVRPANASDPDEDSTEDLKAMGNCAQLDAEQAALYEYWRDRPEAWALLKPVSRRALLAEMGLAAGSF